MERVGTDIAIGCLAWGRTQLQTDKTGSSPCGDGEQNVA